MARSASTKVVMERKSAQGHINKVHLESPFHARILAASTQQEWYTWNSYISPSVIADEELEYFAIRATAALFDISPMVKYAIEGPDAESFLDRLTLRDVTKLGDMRVQYTAWCDDEGQVLDDGTLFRLARDRFHLCCQERHFPWLIDSAIGYDVTIKEVTEEIAGLALQGPTSCAVLKDLGLKGVEKLKAFWIGEFRVGGMAITVSRTGFTGDLGYELFVDAKDALKLWDGLMAAGERHKIRPIGYAALDHARLEAGFIVANHDFVTAGTALRADRTRFPDEIGLDWLVDPAKPGHYNGKRAILYAREHDTMKHVLVGLEIEGNIPADMALVYHRQKHEIGMVSSAAWSPTVKRNIAIATLKRPFGVSQIDDLWVEIYALRELQYQKMMKRVKIVERPFIKLAQRTLTPPNDK